MPPEIEFIYLAPNAESRIGHDEIYLQCIEQMCHSLSWNNNVLLPVNSSIPVENTSRIKRFSRNKLWNPLTYLSLFYKAKKEKHVFFIEQFSIKDLFLLGISALIGLRRESSLMLLFRREYAGWKKTLVRILLRGIQKTLGNRILFITDSELIRTEMKNSGFFKTTVVPIPHIVPLNTSKQTTLSAWWPGVPRTSKGKEEITRIAPLFSQHGIPLYASEEAKIPYTVSLPKYLSRKAYETLFQKVSIILLPYDPTVYKMGTSGILIEAVCSGKVPFVKKGSWLAFELQKYNVGELIIDWNTENVAETILSLYYNAKIRRKLEIMQNDYLRFHNQKSYASIIKSLIDPQFN